MAKVAAAAQTVASECVGVACVRETASPELILEKWMPISVGSGIRILPRGGGVRLGSVAGLGERERGGFAWGLTGARVVCFVWISCRCLTDRLHLLLHGA